MNGTWDGMDDDVKGKWNGWWGGGGNKAIHTDDSHDGNNIAYEREGEEIDKDGTFSTRFTEPRHQFGVFPQFQP